MTPGEFMKRYEAATRAHDLQGTLDLIADDAVYLFSNQTSHIGKPAIQQALAANFAAIKGEAYGMSNLRWIATSDSVAVCVYEYNWSGTIDGRPVSGHGRGTSVLRRIDGEWLVAHEHLSAGRL